jgi:outer membrane protein insertion porin family
MRRPGEFLRWSLALLILLIVPAGADAKSPPKADLKVSGLGLVANRDQRLSLERLLGEQRGQTIEASAIEDAAFLLLSAVQGEGFLKPTLQIETTSAQGKRERFPFDTTLTTQLPRALKAKAVRFIVNAGVRYVVNEVQIEGLTAFSPEVARGYFMPQSALLNVGAARAYTPGRVRRALESVQAELRQAGYADAQARIAEEKVDDKTGKVSLVVAVSEGPRWQVAALRFTGTENTQAVLDFSAQFLDKPWSPLWQQDLRERVRRAFYERGYPEMTVAISPASGTASDGVKRVEVTAAVTPGPQVRMGTARFEGNERTKESVLRRRVAAQPGDLLNPILLERTRYRLSRLGVFSAVDLRYDPPDGAVRDPVFELKEAPRRDASLMLGYGSYEQLRLGVEFRQLNLFGRAHQSRLELVHSMKSDRGEYNYTVPELFGERIDGNARLFGLERQERSFLRQEFGLTLALKRSLPLFKMDATVGYTFQSLRNKENTLSTSTVDDQDVTVGSIDFGLTSDLRDSPLRPRRGIRWYTHLEAASRGLGGESDYQRLESGAGFHTPWGNSRWIHVGVTHGIVTTAGATNDQELPVNKRFYPGGESSIRGYGLGEATPRGPDGLFIGAKTYLLANTELEQALTSTWSAILFFDALGEAVRLSGSSMFDEKLYSVGLGLRYQTLIGPVRLEYGRNLNPRTGDPSGTLHFSVGFPF